MEKGLLVKENVSIKRQRVGATAGLIYKYILDIAKIVIIVATIIAFNELSNNLAKYVLEEMSFSKLKLCFFAFFMITFAFAIIKIYTDFKSINKQK